MKKIKVVSNKQLEFVCQKVDDYTFDFPSSIRKIIKKTDLDFQNLSNEKILIIYNNIEVFFQILNEKIEDYTECLSYVGVHLFENNSYIRKLVLEEDLKRNLDFISNLNELIYNDLQKIELSKILKETREKVRNYYINESDTDIKFVDDNALYNYIMQLLDAYDFMCSDLMSKFFFQIDFKIAFTIRATRFKCEKNISKKRLLVLLGELSDLLFSTKIFFGKNDNFILNFILISYFDTPNKLNSFMTLPLYVNNPKTSEEFLNFYGLKRYLSKGLSKIKHLYFIEIGAYNNSLHNSLDIDFSIAHEFVKNLKEETICSIYEIRDIKLDDIKDSKNWIRKIDLVAEDISKNTGAIIRKQVLDKGNSKILDSINRNLYSYEQLNTDFTIKIKDSNPENIGNRIDLQEYELKYKDKEYKVLLQQVNLRLYYRIYFNDKLIIKEQIFEPNDYDRIFHLIRQF